MPIFEIKLIDQPPFLVDVDDYGCEDEGAEAWISLVMFYGEGEEEHDEIVGSIAMSRVEYIINREHIMQNTIRATNARIQGQTNEAFHNLRNLREEVGIANDSFKDLLGAVKGVVEAAGINQYHKQSSRADLSDMVSNLDKNPNIDENHNDTESDIEALSDGILNEDEED